MNSKGGFGHCKIPRLTIEADQYKMKVKELEERRKEEEEDKLWKVLVQRVRGGNPTPLKRKRDKHETHPPQTLTRPVPTTLGPTEKTAKQQTAGPNNGSTGWPTRDTHTGLHKTGNSQETQNNLETDMRKVENTRAPETPGREGGSGKGRGVEGNLRQKTVSRSRDHSLAKNNRNHHQNLEKGRGEGTPKRKNEEGECYDSPAKRKNLRTNFELFSDTPWTQKNVKKKPSVAISENQNNDGIRKTSQPCHTQRQATD